MTAEATFLDPGTGELVHPETVTKLVKVTVKGYISLASHNQVIAKLERGIRKYPGEMRMLEHIDRFCGLDPLAIIPNSLFMLRNHSEFERVAIVSNDSLLTSAASSLAPLTSTQVETFPNTPEGQSDAKEFIIKVKPKGGQAS